MTTKRNAMITAFSILTFALLCSGVKAEPPITTCQTINSEGSFELGNDLTGLNSLCFVITADHVTLDCQGHSLTCSPFGCDDISHAINPEGNYFELKNCVFNNFEVAIDSDYPNPAHDWNIHDNTFIHTAIPIRTQYVDNIIIENNVMRDVPANYFPVDPFGSMTFGAVNVTIVGNQISNLNGTDRAYGIDVYSASFPTFKDSQNCYIAYNSICDLNGPLGVFPTIINCINDTEIDNFCGAVVPTTTTSTTVPLTGIAGSMTQAGTGVGALFDALSNPLGTMLILFAVAGGIVLLFIGIKGKFED